MAKVLNTSIASGLSGKFGSIVFRTTKSGKTIACRPPKTKRHAKPHPIQLKRQKDFKKFTDFAKHAINDPELKSWYQQRAKPGQTAFNVACQDAAKGPEIRNISRSTTSKSIPCININATDNIEVYAVHVEIFTEDDQLIESGKAINRYIDWIYELKPETAKHSQLKVRVTALDRPGNEARLESIC